MCVISADHLLGVGCYNIKYYKENMFVILKMKANAKSYPNEKTTVMGEVEWNQGGIGEFLGMGMEAWECVCWGGGGATSKGILVRA